MRIPRVYSQQELFQGEVITLAKQTSHHLTNVLRRSVDSKIEVFNQDAKCYLGKIVSVKELVQVELLTEITYNTESNLQISLAFALIKPDRLDFAIQKTVELGVTKIIPIITQRSIVHLTGERLAKKLEHWQAIAISSTAQSHRVKVPEVSSPFSLSDYIGSSLAEQKLYCHPESSNSISKLKITDEKVDIMIGPEGGFTDEELSLLRAQAWQDVGLGKRILRAETAGIAAVTILQSLSGNM